MVESNSCMSCHRCVLSHNFYTTDELCFGSVMIGRKGWTKE